DPVTVAEDLPAGELAVVRDADLVRHRGVRQLGLGAADVADLRDRVDPERQQLAAVATLDPERGAGREPSLLRGARREAREADHVAARAAVQCGPIRGLGVHTPY